MNRVTDKEVTAEMRKFRELGIWDAKYTRILGLIFLVLEKPNGRIDVAFYNYKPLSPILVFFLNIFRNPNKEVMA
ncbi:hypothetical protein [Desulforegula conservatrix]|uniref:hypothetical protein n=1 Tax=Desulforegula conservatrix TaxID=153026 RepID=UPI0004053B23|nr:hypothetical protein [Desulforegula conservatrix]